MVYRGKLGKGCAECRKKKTRCDLARPSCGQCIRASRACSGYRDLESLRLVDETRSVRSKASSASSSSSSSDYSQPRRPSTPAVDYVGTRPQQVACITSFATPSFCASYAATNLFFDRYISVWLNHSKNELDFVATMYSEAAPDGMLDSIVSALGFASLPKHLVDSSLRILANEKYASALHQTQRALRDPALARRDETMATIVLLGLHELVGSDEVETDGDRLSAHLTGAIQLMQLRGDAGMIHVDQHKMYHRVSSQVELCCLHGRQPIPAALLTFEKSMRVHFHAEEIMAAELLHIAARLCDLLASTTLTDPSTVDADIRCLDQIEEDLKAWVACLSFRFRAERVPVCMSEQDFLTHQDIYYNDIAASVMNRYHCIRIAVLEEIIRLVEAESVTSTDDQQDKAMRLGNANSTISKISEDVACSLPHFFGSEACRSTPSLGSGVDRPNMYCGLACLMPIYYASNPVRVPPAMYKWMMRHLEIIAFDIGIPQARPLLAKRLMQGVDMQSRASSRSSSIVCSGD